MKTVPSLAFNSEKYKIKNMCFKTHFILKLKNISREQLYSSIYDQMSIAINIKL